MATLTYTFISICAGGDHLALDVSLNAGASKRLVTTVDDVRAPLSELSADEQIEFVTKTLRVHLAGKTRAQIVTEFQSPVTVTI